MLYIGHICTSTILLCTKPHPQTILKLETSYKRKKKFGVLIFFEDKHLKWVVNSPAFPVKVQCMCVWEGRGGEGRGGGGGGGGGGGDTTCDRGRQTDQCIYVPPILHWHRLGGSGFFSALQAEFSPSPTPFLVQEHAPVIPFPAVSPASEIAWSSPSWTLWRERGREGEREGEREEGERERREGGRREGGRGKGEKGGREERERGRKERGGGRERGRKEGKGRRNISFTIPFLSPSCHTYRCFSVDWTPTVLMPPHSQLPQKLKQKNSTIKSHVFSTTRVYHVTMTSLPLYRTCSRRGLQTLQFLTLGSSLHPGGSHQLGCAGSNVMGGHD